MEEIDLKDMMKVIGKRIWLMVSIVIVCTVGAAVISYTLLTPVYEASTKLIVNQSADVLPNQQININDINTYIKLIDTYKEIILTPRILDLVVEEHPEFHLTPEQLASKLEVSSVNGTQVMTVKVQDESYDRAVEIVNAVSKTFQKEILSIMRVDNVTILNEAKHNVNAKPVKPNPMLNIAIAFVVSLMMALGLVFLLEYMDDTMKSEDDIQQVLELPTLAVIARMKPSKSRKRPFKTMNQNLGGKKHHVNHNA